MGRRSPQRLHLSRKDRKILRRRARGLVVPARTVRRARILLMLDEGRRPLEVAAALGTDKSQVRTWRERYERGGLAALEDTPRSGRPRRIRQRERIEVLSVACRAPERLGVRRVLWSQASLAEYLVRSGRVRQMSSSSVQRILSEAGLKPHKVRMWCTSDDPDYDRKVADVTGLYLDPPWGGRSCASTRRRRCRPSRDA